MPHTAQNHALIPVARQWLRELQECVNTQNYARAQALHAPDVVMFSIRTNLETDVEGEAPGRA